MVGKSVLLDRDTGDTGGQVQRIHELPRRPESVFVEQERDVRLDLPREQRVCPRERRSQHVQELLRGAEPVLFPLAEQLLALPPASAAPGHVE
jgi:hypothetical protein